MWCSYMYVLNHITHSWDDLIHQWQKKKTCFYYIILYSELIKTMHVVNIFLYI